MSERVCYLDNAATTYPKPPGVSKAMLETMKNIGASPGRGGHRMSLMAGKVLFGTRERIAGFFNVPDSRNVVFTKNATESINIALKGTLRPGDHVLASGVEHNAVMRPLEKLSRGGVPYTIVPCGRQGFLSPDDLEKAILPSTRLIVLTHASNVTGTILPVLEVGKIARSRNIIFLVDAAQTAGALRIDMEEMNIDLLACTGHKGLMGPQGTGFLAIREGIKLDTLVEGGTGSRSESIEQPDLLPDKFESGTQNTPGVSGLEAGIAFIENEGLDKIREREKALTRKLLEGLSGVKGVEIFGPLDPEKQTAVVSFRVSGKDPGETAEILDSKYGIITRVGLHCCPLAHKTIGTYPEGTIRVSPGFFTTDSEIDYFLRSVGKI
ncbi:MAG: aminotransferase class V-fold PLP-dependent enzyme [Nitrospinae bacterium]|nr:aminotransferase class V-fold PLP-dependent enzyme [Nitrospinota bacterium]